MKRVLWYNSPAGKTHHFLKKSTYTTLSRGQSFDIYFYFDSRFAFSYKTVIILNYYEKKTDNAIIKIIVS